MQYLHVVKAGLAGSALIGSGACPCCTLVDLHRHEGWQVLARLLMPVAMCLGGLLHLEAPESSLKGVGQMTS